MRLFQNSSLYPGYRPAADQLIRGIKGFSEARQAFLDDLYGGCHVLKPVLDQAPEAFFTNGDQTLLQQRWAREQGMPATTSLEDILLAQIEHHRTEVFYNQDPITYPGAFAKRLPGSVKVKVAWRAAPSGSTQFEGYDLMVCNFPGILRGFEQAGMRTGYFSPALDPRMAPYAANTDRPIDIAFVGSFTRHHTRRTAVLEVLAGLSPQFKVALHLEVSQGTRLAETPVLSIVVPSRYQRPPAVRRLARPPVFGRALYEVLSRAKIVVNVAIDMSGVEKGNIRCFETMGMGALMLSDAGRYPEGMQDGSTFVAYSSLEALADGARTILADPQHCARIASNGHTMLSKRYSKVGQWEDFQRLVAGIPSALSRPARHQ